MVFTDASPILDVVIGYAVVPILVVTLAAVALTSAVPAVCPNERIPFT